MAERLRARQDGFSQILSPVIEHYTENKTYERDQKREEEQRQKRLSDYLDLTSSEQYQNLPLEQKMALPTILFGKDVGGMVGEAEKIKLEREKMQNQKKDEKPPLTLNEELNQRHKRMQDKVKNLSLPFEKRDAFGNTFLEFEEDDRKRAKTLGKINAELNRFARDAEKLYQQYGQPVPEDLQEQMKEQIVVDYDDHKVPLTVVEDIEEFSQVNIPKKYKGKRAVDDNGYILESDGERWKIVGYQGQ